MRILLFLSLLSTFILTNAQTLCGTGVGETPFTIEILSDSSYNGFDLRCVDDCSGYFTAHVTGGSGTFEYLWFGTTTGTPTNAQRLTEVCNQSQIQVIVTDVGQGISCGATYILNVPTAVTTINFSFTDPTCPTSCDGAASHTPFFGVPPYTFLWSNNNINEDADDLCLGPNSLTITDLNGCTFDTTIVIANPPLINANIVFNPVSCDGVCDASAVSMPSGGNGGPYDFSWEQLPANSTVMVDNGFSSTTPSTLCENINYQVLIEDIDGCRYDTIFTIEDVLPITLSVDQNLDASCSNTCDGQIDITISGGSGVYTTIQWFEGLIGAPTGVHSAGPSLSQSDLCPNTNYFITAIDDRGCTNNFQLPQVGSPPPFTFSIVDQDDIMCNGNNDGLIDITVGGATPNTPAPGYTYVWSSNDGGAGFGINDEDQINTLSSGTYKVIYEDALGCKDSADIVISEPNPIITSGVVTNVSCFDVVDGNINLTTVGGNGGYVWTWTSVPSGIIDVVDANLEDQSNLDSAEYFINIEDALGCVYDTIISITKPREIYFNSVVAQMECAGDNDGVIDNSAAFNGVGAYSFLWNSSPVVPIANVNGVSNSNLEASDYTITITDDNLCTKDTVITIEDRIPLVLSPAFSNVACNGNNDGSITISIISGQGAINVSWNGPTAIINNNFAPIGLSPGMYEAIVWDENLCTEVLNFTLEEPDPLVATLSGSDVDCAGLPGGGSVLVTPSGGLLGTSYDIDWDVDGIRGDFDDLASQTPLLAGTYCVNIRDDNNCVLVSDSCITITEPDSIFFGGSTQLDASCFGANDGSIDALVAGGTGTLDLAWTVSACSGPFGNLGSIGPLCAGSYMLTATDDIGCVSDTTFIIEEPNEIVLTVSSTDIVCNGNDDGTISIVVLSGDGPFNINWVVTGGGTPIPGIGNFTPSGLAAGNYQATISDFFTCTKTVNIVINEPVALLATLSGTNLDCNGISTGGSVLVTPNGGLLGTSYDIDWDVDGIRGDFDDTALQEPLLAGIYCVNIRDDNGCVLALDSCITITEPDSIFFSGTTVTEVLCFGDDNASINAIITGGTGGYDFSWNPIPSCSDPLGNTGTVGPLCPGTYTVTVTDDNGCTNDTTFNFIEPVVLTAPTSHTDAGCGIQNGTVTVTPAGGTVTGNYNITWTAVIGTTPPTPANGTNITGLASDTYQVTVTDDNMCSVSGQEVIITDNPPIITVDQVTNLTCNGDGLGAIQTTISGGAGGYTIVWGALNDPSFTSNSDDVFLLDADQYTIQVTDASLCVVTMVINVVEPDALSIILNNQTDATCNGFSTGALDISGQGGTKAIDYIYEWTGSGGYSSNLEDIGSLPIGTYCLNITDDRGCTMTADSCYLVTEPTILQIDNISSTDAQCNVPTGTATVVASGGTVVTDYTYSWVNAGSGADPLVNNLATATGMVNDPYTVTVTDDNGCFTTATVAVQPTNGPAVTIDVINHLTCANDGTGAILTSAGGGSGTLTYSWSSIPASLLPSPVPGNVSSLTGLEGGTYIVNITDGVACTTNEIIVIDEPSPLDVVENISDALCNGAQGMVDISVSGGTAVNGTYRYNWDHNGGSAFTDPEDLIIGAGSYNVIVADDNGCTISGGPYIISEPSMITATTSSISSACLQSTGSVSVMPAGGTPGIAPNSYSFLWVEQANSIPVGNTATASPLPSGCYDVQITDGNDCVLTVTECVSDLTGPTVTIDQQVNPTCNGGIDGLIDLTIVTPSGPPTSTWTATNGSAITINGSPEDIFMLAADDYNVTVTDANLCSTNESISLIEVDPIDIEANIVDVKCSGGNDGSIGIIVNNAGNGIASISWTGPSGFTSGLQNLTMLESGTYCLTVIDNNSCRLDTCFTLVPAPSINIVSSFVDTDCDTLTGQLNATATGGVPGYIYDWTGPGITVHPSGALVTGIGVGTYNLTVTDKNGAGCTSTVTETVNTAVGPVITLDGVNHIDCFGSNIGDIFVSVAGGTFPYLFDWDNISGTDNDEDNLSIPAGTYNLLVTDNSGCDATLQVIITEPSQALSVSGIENDLGCNAGGNGSIDLTIAGGTLDYTIDWSQGGTPTGSATITNTTFTIPNLDALSYDILVTDDNGCAVAQSFVLDEGIAMIPTTSSIDSDCGFSNGEVSASAIGGTDGVTYMFSWEDFNTGLPTITPNQATVSGLPQGTYEVTIEDLNGCQVTDLVSISEVGGPDVTGVTTAVECFGDMNGTISLDVVGPPTISFTWTGPTPIGNIEDPTMLNAGNYAVAVVDGNGCTTNDNFSVAGPAAAITVNGVVTHLNCFDDKQGSIDLTITGGTPGFIFSWTGPNGYTNNIEDINNLEAGTYTIRVEDSEGCEASATSFIVTQPDEVVVTPVITAPSCGIADGAILANVIGGTVAVDYSYEWTNLSGPTVMPDTDNDVVMIFAGNYSLVIGDDNGCLDTTIISVNNVNAAPLSFAVTDVQCFGLDNGSIDLTVNGTNTYTYNWNNLLGSSNPEDQLGGNLPPGAYAVSVMETPTGCISVGSTTIAEPDELKVVGTEDHLECFGDGSGGIDISPQGGTGTLTFDWDNLAGTDNLEDQVSIGAGSYQITITDDNGCTVIDSYTLTQPLEIDITAIVTHNECHGGQIGEIDVTTNNGVGQLTFAWDTPSANEDETALYAGFYQFVVTDQNGCMNDSIFEITEPAPFIFNPTVTDANCNLFDGQITTSVSGGTLTSLDYNYNWLSGGLSVGTTPDLLLQAAGTYILGVTDDLGCFDDTTISIDNINAPVLTLDNITDVTCVGDGDGDINITTTLGTGNYTYVWNPNGVSQNEDLVDQPAGTYQVQVTDGAGCISTLGGLVIGAPDQVVASVVTNDATCGICNGDATLTGSGGDGNYNFLWPSSNNTSTETGMCAGVYNVQITDGLGCEVTQDIVINNTGGPTGEILATVDPLCNGGTGTATVTAIGGTGSITYLWLHDNTVGPTNSNLIAGTYFVQMSDFNGCIRIAQVDIFEPDAITFNSNISLSTCNNADGNITLTNITGGTGSIDILWNTPVGLTTVGNPNIPAGIYNVALTDDNMCTVSQNFTITDVAAPDLVLTASDALCNGDATGMISSSISGAVGTVSYQWIDVIPSVIPGETNADINSLLAGDYTLQATDGGTGCVVLETITVGELAPLTISLPTIQDAGCDIACDGEATIIVAGGKLPYTYSWPTPAGGPTATDLCVGLNTVLITDHFGCIIQTTIDVGFDNQLDAVMVETDATCGDCDGLATVTPIGGSGGYTVNWYDATVGFNHSQLCAGIYDFTIVDNANGCSVDLNATINNIGGPDNEVITITDVTCNGGSDGAATVVPSGGTPGYDFLWIPAGQTSGTISGQSAGTYNLEVIDDNECIRVVPIDINEPIGMDLQFVSTDANCGSSDGTITLIPVNGIAPITYTWNGPGLVGTGNQSENNLAVGIYTISATDSTGCVVTIQVPISTTTPPAFVVSANDISCYGLADGDATAIGAGLTFNWSTGVPGSTISGLTKGTYIVTATDATTGCTSVQSVIVNEPDTLMMGVSNIDAPLCFGECNGEVTAIATGGSIPYSYAWSSSVNMNQTETGLCDGITTVTITDRNGCVTGQDFTISEPIELSIIIDNVTDATCVNSQDGTIDVTAAGGTGIYEYTWTSTPSGFTSDDEDLMGLNPTTYNVTVTDESGCSAMNIVPVDTIFIVLADAGLDTSFCVGNCIVLEGSSIGPGSPTYEWNTNPVTGVLSTEDTVEVCQTIDGIYPFTLTVSDANCTHTDTVLVTVNPLPNADAGTDLEEIIGSLQTIGGSPTGPLNSEFYWTPNDGIVSLLDTTTANPQIEMIKTIDYVVFVTDTNGCVNSDTVNVSPLPEIVFPNGFTPNADGINDDWQIDYIDQFPESVVEVYNRWGQLLFRNVGYTQRWDGRYEGEDLPIGTYYYIIELNNPLFPESYSGPVTIMR